MSGTFSARERGCDSNIFLAANCASLAELFLLHRNFLCNKKSLKHGSHALGTIIIFTAVPPSLLPYAVSQYKYHHICSHDNGACRNSLLTVNRVREFCSGVRLAIILPVSARINRRLSETAKRRIIPSSHLIIQLFYIIKKFFSIVNNFLSKKL